MICRLPGVLEAAVVGLPDPILGEQIGVMIFGRELNSEAELLALARNRFAQLRVRAAPCPTDDQATSTRCPGIVKYFTCAPA